MVRPRTRRLGRDAEDIAFGYLLRHRLRPVARNFRTRRGEIDLIMLDGSCLVFVEVRYRGSSSFVVPTATVDARKQQKLRAAAAVFLAKHERFHDHTCRFDVVGVSRKGGDRAAVQWLKDAFRTPG